MAWSRRLSQATHDRRFLLLSRAAALGFESPRGWDEKLTIISHAANEIALADTGDAIFPK